MGADLSFDRPKCRYPNPNNKKNQVGPLIVNDPYKNKRGPVGLNINVSNPLSSLGSPNSALGSMLQQGLQSNPAIGSMLQQGIQPNSGLGSMLQQGLQSNPAIDSMLQQGLQSNPQLTGFLSGLSQRSPQELEKLSRNIAPGLQGMDPSQVSQLASMASPYLSKLTPKQNQGLLSGLGPSLNTNTSIPEYPSTPPPPVPVESQNGGSKNKKVKELRKICQKHHIQITKNGKYLTKKELIKIIQKKKLD